MFYCKHLQEKIIYAIAQTGIPKKNMILKRDLEFYLCTQPLPVIYIMCKIGVFWIIGATFAHH